MLILEHNAILQTLNSSFGNFGLVAVGLGSTQYSGIVSNTNADGDIITSTLPENQDTVVFTNVTDGIGSVRRPFDGQVHILRLIWEIIQMLLEQVP